MRRKGRQAAPAIAPWTANHFAPRCAGMPRSSSPAAMARSDAQPAAMAGARSRARLRARAFPSAFERQRRVEIPSDHRLTVIHPGEGAVRVWSVHRVAGHEFGWTARSAQKFMNAAKVFGKDESRNPQTFGTQDTLKADAGPLTSQSPSKARKRGHGNMKEHRSNRSNTREHRSNSWEHRSSSWRGLRNQRVYKPTG